MKLGSAEEQAHPPMGETRDTAFGAARPEDQLGLHFRRNLPGRRKRRGLGSAPLHHRGNDAVIPSVVQRGRPAPPSPSPGAPKL